MMKTHLFFISFLFISQLAFSQWTQQGADIDVEYIGNISGSVSLSSNGSIVAIGAPSNDDNGENSGHVQIYEFDGMNWNQLGQDIDGEAAGDGSGWKVSLSSDGTIIAIGAYGNDGNGNNSGHVRIYQWDGVSWNQLGQDIEGEAAGDQFSVVSLNSDGTIIAIGAGGNDGDSGYFYDNRGHVRVYQFDGAVWNQLGQDIEGEAAGDWSASVSLNSDGAIIAIGADENDGDSGNPDDNRGHVRVYQFDGVNWSQLGQDIDGEAAGDRSGQSLSLSSDGTRVATGGFLNDADSGNPDDNRGRVRVYQFDGAVWNQLGQDIDGEAAGDWSGRSVSLSNDGTRIAMGAYWNDGNGNDSGHVRIYGFDGISWNQLGQDIDGETAGDHSGKSVSLNSDGSIVVIGGNDNNNEITPSHVRVYSFPYTQIPDPNFELVLINQGIDSEGLLDGQVLTADISSIINLDVAHKNISDLTGIEGFTALEILNCTNNWISNLNVSNNSDLITLDCSNNKLNTLTLNSSGSLTTLNCSDNRFNGSLDLSGQPSLTNLDTTQNTRLFCIGVDDEIAANAGLGIYTAWLSDGATLYSQNCEEVAMAKGNMGAIKDGENNTEEVISAKTVHIYPNPARERLYISLPAERELLGITIYNLQGKQVAKAKTTMIPITHLAKGIYFVEIQLSDGDSILKKVIVAKD